MVLKSMTPKSWLSVFKKQCFSSFCIMLMIGPHPTMFKFEINKEQHAFGCQWAFGSHSQIIEIIILPNVTIQALCKYIICMMKKVFFWCFSTAFYHFGTCAGLNTQQIPILKHEMSGSKDDKKYHLWKIFSFKIFRIKMLN